MILEVSNLSFSFLDKMVLEDISFSIKQGDMLAVLGPNGVGKTTLIRLLTGILQSDKGSISYFNSGNSNTVKISQRRLMGIMYPIEGIYLKMTGYEYLAFIGAICEMDSDKIKLTIEQLSNDLFLKDEIHREIKKYSSGTKKKIEFCAAIMHSPKILFLDEPFESVDPKASFEIKMYIKEYVRLGGSLIITSHILETIQNLCTRYIMIKNGYVVSSNYINKNENLEKIYMEVMNHE